MLRINRSLVTMAAALLLAMPASAQSPFKHQGLDLLHPPDSAFPSEQVDPASNDGRLASYLTGAVTHRFSYEFNRPKRLWTTGGSDALDLTYGYDNVDAERRLWSAGA